MVTPYSLELEVQMRALYKRLSEKDRRLYAGIEALKLPTGGISYIARLLNCSRDTLMRGIKEINEVETLAQGRSRKAGGGRTPVHILAQVEHPFWPNLNTCSDSS